MPRVPLSHVQSDQPSWVGKLWLACVASALVACGGTETPKVETPPGQVSFALEFPDGVDIEFVDYDVTLSYLESTPVETYNNKQFHEVRQRGELTAVMPCHAGPDGSALNQIDIVAVVKVRNRTETFRLEQSAIFECRENKDTLVNVTLSILGALGDGFVDIDAIPIGTFCSSNFDRQADTTFGVCGAAACGNTNGNEDFWVFKNHCDALQAENPTYWVCGSPTDWEIIGEDAISRFPPPQHDGEWTFGVIALDGYVMAQVDPTLTNPNGLLTVWTGASGTRARLTRVNGVIQENGNEGRVYAYAADLELAPQQVGQPAVHLLLVVHNTVNGGRTTYQTKFGRCDLPTLGVNLFPGLHNPVMDIRRDGNSAVRLILADPITGFASLVATCESEWDTTGAAPKPAVRCNAPTPLLP